LCFNIILKTAIHSKSEILNINSKVAAIPGSKNLKRGKKKNLKNQDGEIMSTLLILGLIIVSIVTVAAIFSWICYKNFAYENRKEFF